MEKMKYVRSWYEFIQDTTMHGVKHANMEKTPSVRRVLWSVFVLACIGYFTFASYLFMNDFTRRLVETKYKVQKASNLKLPAVTICNRNLLRKSFAVNMTTNEKARDILKFILMDVYMLSGQTPPPDGKFNWSDPIAASVANMSSDKVDASLLAGAHQLNSTFRLCTVRKKVVPCYTIVKQVKTDAGYCYQFNGDGRYKASAAGIAGGIQFILDTITSEYYIGPHSYAEGFSVALHDVGVVPLVTELSYGATPGTATNMDIQKTETIRVPPPADDGQADCFVTTKETNPLHYFTNYTYSGCYQGCKVSFVMNRCGCRDALHPALNNSKTCNWRQMLYCSKPAEDEFHYSADHLAACNCRSVCTDVNYSAKISVLRFPSTGFVESVGIMPRSAEYMRENYVALSVFYGQMSFVSIEEKIAYTPYDLIANLGGTLGLCIGASMLTLAEFVEFGIMAFARLIQRKQSPMKTPLQGFNNSVAAMNQ